MKFYQGLNKLSPALWTLAFLFLTIMVVGQGTIQPNTNAALPSSYNFQEYVFAEPNDQGNCQGTQNTTAVINDIFLSQTHRHVIGHPLMFTIGERPALFQIALTGTGQSPDVQVEGILNGTSLGTLCLNGPANLSASIDLSTPNFEDYFSVTLPKAWIKIGLELNVYVGGNSTRQLTQDDLKISPYTELNLVMFDIDIMDYNNLPHRTPIFDDFLEEVASAIPASVIRFGQFPEPLVMPTLAAQPFNGDTHTFDKDEQLAALGLNTGDINGIGLAFINGIQLATGDLPNTIYFGNTLNLDPGGFGSEGSFVSYDFNNIFIHELGHALSLPHWGEEWFRVPNQDTLEYSYPYGGELQEEAGGRGEAWTFIQDDYEFVSPICGLDNEFTQLGTERSDCMAREFPCEESRSDGNPPWDGFGVFSAIAMNRFLSGSYSEIGQVNDRGQMIEYQLPYHRGYPIVTLQNGARNFARTHLGDTTYVEDMIQLPGQEQLEQDVYLLYGCAHAYKTEANIIYKPIKYKGTLIPTLDPTDPATFASLQNITFEEAPALYGEHRDITLKVTYADGSERHVLVPFANFEHPGTGAPDEELTPGYFSVAVSGDQPICGVEIYRRDFIISDEDDERSGNINDPSQNITAQNFMNGATLMSVLDNSCNCPGTLGYIEPGTSCDDGNPYTLNDVSDGQCNCIGELVDIEDCGQIFNGQFEVNLTGWGTWGINASSTNAEASLEITNDFDAGMGQTDLDFIQGEQYTISFEAYASQAKAIEVAVIFDLDPFTEHFRETVNLTTSKQAYELSFTFNAATIGYGALLFEFSGDMATVSLDNICLENANVDQVMPVNFISFSAEVVNNTVELDWAVGDEINVSNYVVQRADETDPNNFINIGSVTANDSNAYSSNDQSPFNGQNYYRIVAVDFDGSETISEIVTLNFTSQGLLEIDVLLEVDAITLFPNPTEGIFEISGPKDDYNINILNINGLLVQSINYTGNAHSIDISELPAGLLFIEIRNTQNSFIGLKKIIKQ